MSPREKELTEQLAQCQAALAESLRDNAMLRQKIDLLVRRVFGASSEPLDPAQLELLLSLPAGAAVVATPEVQPVPEISVVRSRKERTPRLPENLPVVEEIIGMGSIVLSNSPKRSSGRKVTAN